MFPSKIDRYSVHSYAFFISTFIIRVKRDYR